VDGVTATVGSTPGRRAIEREADWIERGAPALRFPGASEQRWF
jgi:hypothetical protein